MMTTALEPDLFADDVDDLAQLPILGLGVRQVVVEGRLVIKTRYRRAALAAALERHDRWLREHTPAGCLVTPRKAPP